VEGITAPWAGLERKAGEVSASLSGAVNSLKARIGQEGNSVRIVNLADLSQISQNPKRKKM
jgi:hypothetical protein